MPSQTKNSMISGKTTRESSCNALPAAFRSSPYNASNNDDVNKETIMDKIIADRFAFTLVLLCCLCAFFANIVASIHKLLPSDTCSLKKASIIGPMEEYQCPFPIINSVFRISISCYLICFLFIVVIILQSFKNYGCCPSFSIDQCITCTMHVLSFSHYLCFISLIMDCNSMYTAFRFSQYKTGKLSV